MLSSLLPGDEDGVFAPPEVCPRGHCSGERLQTPTRYHLPNPEPGPQTHSGEDTALTVWQQELGLG